MKKASFLFILLLSFITFSSCDKDDDNNRSSSKTEYDWRYNLSVETVKKYGTNVYTETRESYFGLHGLTEQQAEEYKNLVNNSVETYTYENVTVTYTTTITSMEKFDNTGNVIDNWVLVFEEHTELLHEGGIVSETELIRNPISFDIKPIDVFNKTKKEADEYGMSLNSFFQNKEELITWRFVGIIKYS